ncbi:sorting nexin-13-like isoform X2 [Atheta coriaria]|uniref:sorting nexin-13-like isoform X2 n=1 Tax=Dalotia coriaria TaxID=877792 RepID=UPI0031F349EE
MERNNKPFIWIVLVIVLFATTFGCFWCSTLAISFSTFLVGLLSYLYLSKGSIDSFYRSCGSNPLENIISDGGLQQILKQTLSPKRTQKSDNRVTGSEIIDSSLHEILNYIIRDYVLPWYAHISNDDEFTQKAIRKTAQRVAINISNRAKNVDWIPYLTTRFVDDAATHLRLFKQARAKVKQEKPKSPRGSPRRDLRNSPKRSHKRHKSETDALRNLTTRDRRDVGQSRFYSPDVKQATLEDVFFELELKMENNKICRDQICINAEGEQAFLCELVEYLLYFLLPDEDFDCKALRFFLREIFANCVIIPLIAMLSDPDYINQAFIWLCVRDIPSSDIFLTTLRITDNCDELKYTKEQVSKEIQLLRSRDSGGESDLNIKQQLSSLYYVVKLIDSRLAKMDNFEDYEKYKDMKTIELPLEAILKNSVALSYYIDYVSTISKQPYIFFYLNIEGWKVSVEQQLCDLQLNKMKGISNDNAASIYENIRSTAASIYDQYIGDKSEYKIDVNQGIVHKLFFRIRNINEEPSELWFDDVQKAIFDIMQSHEDFLPGFKKHKSYFKMLEELDLIQQNVVEEDVLSLNAYDTLDLEYRHQQVPENGSSNSHTGNGYTASQTNELLLTPDALERVSKHTRSLSDVPYLKVDQESIGSSNSDLTNVKPEEEQEKDENLRVGMFTLCVKIIETGIVCEKGKTFGIYATQVRRQYDESGFLEEWHIYRRYSDFHDLQCKIKEKYSDLAKITFPGKKTFHNMDRAVLERRMKMLGNYMQEITQAHILHSHPGLKELLMMFLEQGEYDRVTSGGPISNTIGTIVNPIKSGMKTIKNMPETLMHTVDEVVEKVFHPKTPVKVMQHEGSKVGAYLDSENNDNIPLRIMLLLVDEVFDLKSRNQWLRRNIVTILRQIVRTMFGDIVNRRILEYVEIMTSPKNVAHYLHIFKQSFWPNGVKADIKQDRDDAIKYRTRVAAKVALLSCLTDELKHIIGSDTTRKGLLTVFELFQRPVLNRRLVYVLLESILGKLFPDKDKPISDVFEKLYAKSREAELLKTS